MIFMNATVEKKKTHLLTKTHQSFADILWIYHGSQTPFRVHNGTILPRSMALMSCDNGSKIIGPTRLGPPFPWPHRRSSELKHQQPLTVIHRFELDGHQAITTSAARLRAEKNGTWIDIHWHPGSEMIGILDGHGAASLSGKHLCRHALISPRRPAESTMPPKTEIGVWALPETCAFPRSTGWFIAPRDSHTVVVSCYRSRASHQHPGACLRIVGLGMLQCYGRRTRKAHHPTQSQSSSWTQPTE